MYPCYPSYPMGCVSNVYRNPDYCYTGRNCYYPNDNYTVNYNYNVYGGQGQQRYGYAPPSPYAPTAYVNSQEQSSGQSGSTVLPIVIYGNGGGCGGGGGGCCGSSGGCSPCGGGASRGLPYYPPSGGMGYAGAFNAGFNVGMRSMAMAGMGGGAPGAAPAVAAAGGGGATPALPAPGGGGGGAPSASGSKVSIAEPKKSMAPGATGGGERKSMAPGAKKSMAPGEKKSMAGAKKSMAPGGAKKSMAPGGAKKSMAPGGAKKSMAPGGAKKSMAPGAK